MSGSISTTGQHPDRHTITLAGDINVFVAAELHRTCVQIPQESSSVEIDCHEVGSLDIAALQVLVALKDAVTGQGGMLEISGLSAEVKDTIQLAGLWERLGLGDPSAAEGALNEC